MYSPARSAVSVESEDGWVVWFSAEAPDGKPRRARPPRAPAPKLTVPKPPVSDGGMGQTLGELAAAHLAHLLLPHDGLVDGDGS